MEYTTWRNDIFGQSPDADPVNLELLSETYPLSHEENFDDIDRALVDSEIHRLFSRDQIGIGLQLIYSNSCSDICFCYIEAGEEQRRVIGIQKLDFLYTNYFARYCVAPVRNIGNDRLDGGIGFLCYMFWDIFVLYPGNASRPMISAALNVMHNAIRMENDNCIASAIHGLGHWAMDELSAIQLLEEWLVNPTTKNASVIEYARQASTGYIL